LKVAAKSESPKWEWTKTVPLKHKTLYSVEGTVNQFGVFLLVINSDDEVAEASLLQQWEEGILSAKRAPLKILEDMGWIKKLDSASPSLFLCEWINRALMAIGVMRPRSLSRQHRDPETKKHAFYQISYTHKGRGGSEYV
jgi:hypothetical protein